MIEQQDFLPKYYQISLKIMEMIRTGEQGVQFADYMTFGLACDHRVIDGAYGARFLASIADNLENLKI